MANKKRSNSLINKIMSNRKSQFLTFMIMFAVIGGLYYLYRSSAAVQLVYFRLGDAYSNNNIPGMSYSGASVKSVQGGDAKKPTTTNYLQLSKATSEGLTTFTGFQYNLSLGQGNYRACTKIKIDTPDSNVQLRVQGDLARTTGSTNFMDTANATTVGEGGGSTYVEVGTWTELCSNFSTMGDSEDVRVVLVASPGKHELVNNVYMAVPRDIEVLADDFSISLFESSSEERMYGFKDIQNQYMHDSGPDKRGGTSQFILADLGLISWVSYLARKDHVMKSDVYEGRNYAVLPLVRNGYDDAIGLNERLIISLSPMKVDGSPIAKASLGMSKIYQACFIGKANSEGSTIQFSTQQENYLDPSTYSVPFALTDQYKEYCSSDIKSIDDSNDYGVYLFPMGSISVIDAYIKFVD